MLHPKLAALELELRNLSVEVDKSSAEDRSTDVINGNWTFPRVDRHDLSNLAEQLADDISRRGESVEDIDQWDNLLTDLTQRVKKIRSELVAHLLNGNAQAAATNFMLALYCIRDWLRQVLEIDSHELDEALATLRVLKTKVRQLQGQIMAVEPSIDGITSMMNKIVETHDAATQFPHDLEELRQGQKAVRDLTDQVREDHRRSQELAEKLPGYQKNFDEQALAAERTIASCQSAMRISTSYGLASAFEEQAKTLRSTVAWWIGGLVGALAAGASYGGYQLSKLADAIQSDNPTIIWTRMIISVLSVGAPVWLAWLATKQIGQRFRLAEDYAYKASISKAYEGYRKEAVDLDPEFQSKLFASALARLDEQPLRFVEHETHGSPWHEFLASETMKEALKLAPELASRIADMARNTVAEAKEKKRQRQIPKDARAPEISTTE